MPPHFRPWLDAWADASYAPGGFWRSSRPLDHFRTASTGSSAALAKVLLPLLAEHPRVRSVLELGAGDGLLLDKLASLRPGLALAGVDLRDRPANLSTRVAWCGDLWDVRADRWATSAVEQLLDRLPGPTLVVCAEWLDDLPCPVASRSQDGVRLVEVDAEGHERPGPRPAGEELDWVTRWSPWSQRLEIGLPRDRAWAWICSALRRRGGLALLIDYGHLSGHRPVGGSLAAYSAGRPVVPRPSPEVNVTAAVAIDSLADAGHRAGATTLLRARQSQIVSRRSPAPAGTPRGPSTDPLADLVARSHRAALGSSAVWGTQWWLLQAVVADP